jgi:hypothetical protein
LRGDKHDCTERNVDGISRSVFFAQTTTQQFGMAQQAIHNHVAEAIDLLDLGKLIRAKLDNFPRFEPTVEEQVRDALLT